jgi:phosphate:Na+ symporter
MEFWKFFAGLGLFLYGMDLTEHVLKKVAGRSFKVFLKKYTKNLFKGIIGGALITGLLQSSSVVSLLVLAFVGAGIITFRNALGVILGSNLGTTISSWIVALVGFKLNIESFTLPVIAIAATGMFFLHQQKKIYNSLRLLFAISMLFLGIGYMKSGADLLVTQFDFSLFEQYPTIVFVLLGFILTTIIQSSSATVAITLTALHAQAVALPAAFAIVIGSELGTTIKIILVASKGAPDKKRVAWGNFTFNIITIVIAFVFLNVFIHLITNTLHINDPVIGLVFFQSGINLLSIIIFLPFINSMARWLEKHFLSNDFAETSLIGSNLPIVADVALDAVYHETEKLLIRIASFHKHLLSIDSSGNEGFFQSLTKRSGVTENLYEKLKKTEGEILIYCAAFQPDDLDTVQRNFINQYLAAVRHGIHSAKALKDIAHNIHELAESGNDVKHDAYHRFQQEWKIFDDTFNTILPIDEHANLFESLKQAMKSAYEALHQNNLRFINSLKSRYLSEVETSTLMNVELEMLSAKKSLLRALAHLKLDASQADAFEFLPEQN